jgi:sensor histidine kinase regulating citrate/malate metabolism
LLAFKFGRHFTKSLFEQGSQKEWAVYSLGPSLSCAVMLALLIAPQSAWNIILLALLVFWSLAVLCFAIINTHEKSKQKYEADFARDIITTGREHYKKMNVLYDEIRIMKHDYKFHLKTTLDLLHRGDIEKGSEYLSSLQSQMEEKELSNFCDNPVINSLVTDYVRRCKELNIDISVSISIPGDFSVPNYEMCIVFGNLLENAMEACQKLAANRKIEFVIKPKGKQIASMVRNTFDGNVIMEDDKFVSTKNGQPGGDPSGLGLQSVKAVIQRYGDLFYTNYEKEWFNVFVLWNDNKTG